MSNICEGTTKSGVRCKNRTRHEFKRCRFHINLDMIIVKPQSIVPAVSSVPSVQVILPEQCSAKVDCCVCMEEMPESDKLDCGHEVCRGCVSQLRNDKCPMCRRVISARHVSEAQKSQMRQRFMADLDARHLAAVEAYLATLTIV